MKLFISYFLMLWAGALFSTQQTLPEKGVPLLQTYTPADYHNHGKVWSIDSAANGIVYMAADKGLLEYDGETWKAYKGSEGFTRSILVAGDSLIYTGSDLDFGYWEKTPNLDFEYTSLYPFREELAAINEEFWGLHRFGEHILFVSEHNIYISSGENLTKISAPNRFTGSYNVQGKIFFADEQEGLFEFEDLSLKQVIDFPEITDFEISGIYPYQDGLVLVTRNSGLFIYRSGNLSLLNSSLSQELINAGVFSFEQINGSYLAFGTVQKGLFIADQNGTVIHRINRLKGLPNNTILSLHYSANGKLWLGMDYGISSLYLKNNITYFHDYRGDFGTGYTAILKDDVFFLGTNQGLFRADWNELDNNSEFNRFRLIPGTEGQVWELTIIDETLFVAHDRGLFTLNSETNTVQRISDRRGIWTVVPYNDYLLAGTYNGISIFSSSDGEITYLRQMEHILGSVNQIVVEKDRLLWINIPNFGVIRALLTEELYPDERLITEHKQFEGNDPYLLHDEAGIHLITDLYRYSYSSPEQEFILQEEAATQSYIHGLLPGVFHPVTLNQDYEFYPVFNGFALKYLGSEYPDYSSQNVPVFRKMEAFNNDERIFFSDNETISYQLNNLLIKYIIPNENNVLYQYRLKETDNWSDWSDDTSLELIGLKHGNYQLNVRSMVNGSVTETAVLSFRINPPWYLSWYALSFYLILLIITGYLMLVWQKKSLKKQKEELLQVQKENLRRQEEKHKQQIAKLEQERLQSEYDDLKKQLRSKTIELAKKAKENEDKNRLLLTLKEKIRNIQNKPEGSKIRWDEIYKLLDSYINQDDNTFEIQMDELHQDFYQRLREKYPELSGNDLRLCAYLKLGFNSKEIAEFINIQPSSVYINRSRLRKKLDLDAEQNLHDFLNSI